MNATDAQKEASVLLDDYFLKLLRAGGKKVITSYNDDGSANVETVDLTAADLNAIRSRLRDVKVDSVPAENGAENGTPSLLAEAQMRFKGRAIPPLSDAKDAATG